MGPSYDGSVILDIGGDIGALVLMTPESMHLVEIEISPVEGDVPVELPQDAHAHTHSHADGAGHEHSHDHAHASGPVRTHVAVRERRGPAGVRYAAIYPGLRAGKYTIWDVDGSPHKVVTITGGEVLQIDWR
ncbi:MAG: hypothetical protein M3O28_00320 [Actinomycetota bacterium]|nr:hypothetical protein [Actinomycetota bacterium]